MVRPSSRGRLVVKTGLMPHPAPALSVVREGCGAPARSAHRHGNFRPAIPGPFLTVDHIGPRSRRRCEVGVEPDGMSLRFACTSFRNIGRFLCRSIKSSTPRASSAIYDQRDTPKAHRGSTAEPASARRSSSLAGRPSPRLRRVTGLKAGFVGTRPPCRVCWRDAQRNIQ
jgi:hypothetical protein